MDYYQRRIMGRQLIRNMLPNAESRNDIYIKIGDTYGLTPKFVDKYLEELKERGAEFEI